MVLFFYGEILTVKVGEVKGSFDCKGLGRIKDIGVNECCFIGSLLLV